MTVSFDDLIPSETNNLGGADAPQEPDTDFGDLIPKPKKPKQDVSFDDLVPKDDTTKRNFPGTVTPQGFVAAPEMQASHTQTPTAPPKKGFMDKWKDLVQPITDWNNTAKEDIPRMAGLTVQDIKDYAEKHSTWAKAGLTKQQYDALPFAQRLRVDAGKALGDAGDTAKLVGGTMSGAHLLRDTLQGASGLADSARDLGVPLGKTPEALRTASNLGMNEKKVDEFLTPDSPIGLAGAPIRSAMEMVGGAEALKAASATPGAAKRLLSLWQAAQQGGQGYKQAKDAGLDVPIAQKMGAANAVIGGLAPVLPLSSLGEGNSAKIGAAISDNPVVQNIIAKGIPTLTEAELSTIANNAVEKIKDPDRSIWDQKGLPEMLAQMIAMKGISGDMRYKPKDAIAEARNLDLNQPIFPTPKVGGMTEASSGADALVREKMQAQQTHALERVKAGTLLKTYGELPPEQLKAVQEYHDQMQVNHEAKLSGNPEPYPNAPEIAQGFTPEQQKVSDLHRAIARDVHPTYTAQAEAHDITPNPFSEWYIPRSVVDHPGAELKPTAPGGDKTKSSSELKRTYVGFTDENGNRLVGSLDGNTRAQLTEGQGSLTRTNEPGVWEDRDGNRYNQGTATVSEIEASTGHTYSENPLATHLAAAVNINSAHANLLWQKKVASTVGWSPSEPGEPMPEGYRLLGPNASSKYRMLEGIALPDKWANALNESAKDKPKSNGERALGFFEGAKNAVMKANFAVKPFVHHPNMAWHGLQEAGLTTPKALVNFDKASQAWDDYSAGHVTPLTESLMRAGQNVIGHSQVGTEFGTNVDKATGKANFQPEDATAGIGWKQGEQANKVTWKPHDKINSALIMTKGEQLFKKPWLELTPEQQAQSVFEVSRHNPDYNVTFADVGQSIANNPAMKGIGMFPRYTSQKFKAVINSFGDALKLNQGDVSPELAKERQRSAISGLATIAALYGLKQTVGKKAVQGLTGNDETTVKAGGSIGIMENLAKIIEGKGEGVKGLAQELLYTSPVFAGLDKLQGKVASEYGETLPYNPYNDAEIKALSASNDPEDQAMALKLKREKAMGYLMMLLKVANYDTGEIAKVFDGKKNAQDFLFRFTSFAKSDREPKELDKNRYNRVYTHAWDAEQK